MAIYTKIDVDTCISCDACCTEAPSVYEMRDTAWAFVDDNMGTTPVKEEFVEHVMNARDSCPVEAVLVSEDPF